MKIGAQMYSLRLQSQNIDQIRDAFARVKAMGYQMVQASGKGFVEADPAALKDLSQEFELPIPLTHFPTSQLENDLDAVIRYHKTAGIPVVGLGAMPKEMRDGKYETFKIFLDRYDRIAKKLGEAGLRFAYHNHNFEFDTLDNGRRIFDYLVEDCDWDIIADVCWIHIGGGDIAGDIARLKGRLYNAHLKDVRPFTPEQVEAVKADPSISIKTSQSNFCPLGEGEVDLDVAVRALEENGCVNAFVEQDNASTMEDPFGQMSRSADYLKSKGLL